MPVLLVTPSPAGGGPSCRKQSHHGLGLSCGKKTAGGAGAQVCSQGLDSQSCVRPSSPDASHT